MGGSDPLEQFGAGRGLVVGTSGPDGEPRAARAWASRVVEEEPLCLRIVMTADDPVAVANLAPGTSVAVTGADVRTLRSVQVKGRVRSAGPASDDDRVLAAEHTKAFFHVVHETDGHPLELIRRIAPGEVMWFELDVDEWFDQSPGPAAGRPLGPR